MAPLGVIRPTGWEERVRLNHMLPSGPFATPVGKPCPVPRGHSVILPRTVLRPIAHIRLLNIPHVSSMNHMFPSGPATIEPTRYALALRPARNSLIFPSGV